MKILITGGCGFIGTNFIRRFTKNYGHEIVNVDKLTYAANEETLDLCKTYGHIDISYSFYLEQVFEKEKDIDVIIHMAAESHVDNSIANASPFIQTNVVGTYNMLEMARKYKVPTFVHISTDEVFGDLKYKDEPGFHKNSPMRPNSPYASSKASAEMLCRSYYKTYGMDMRIVRGCNNFGEHQHAEKLIPKVITRALNNETIGIYDNGEQIREWIYVDYFCNVIMNVADKGKRGGVYHAGSGIELNNYELVCKILKHLDKPRSLIEFGHSRKAHDFRYALNMDEEDRKMSGGGLSFQWHLDKTINFYKERHDNVRKKMDSSSSEEGFNETFPKECSGT